MRCPLGAALAFVPFAAALAQTQTPAALPALRPPLVQTPSAQAPVVVPVPQPQPSPAPPAPAQPSQPAQGQAPPPQPQGAPAPSTAPAGTPPAAPVPAPPPVNVWLPKPVADLVALDKVTARATRLTVRVGQSVAFGPLSIAVRACEVRPPDQPADATAFLDITDAHPGAAQFHGWMLVSAPAVSMLEHPIYDVRVTGCQE